MKYRKKLIVFAVCVILLSAIGLASCVPTEVPIYYYPAEDDPHAATWLTWPHEFTYGKKYQQEVEPIWIEMTRHIVGSENVNIIAYNLSEENKIRATLTKNGIPLDNINVFIAMSNDVWVRDTGPIFVRDNSGKMYIADFAFDGWGGKCDYELDDIIPEIISDYVGIPRLDISDFVLEGGSVEISGGTCMATLSSVVSENRNTEISVKDAERNMTKYLGVTNFIWLEGVIDEDITDAHIDGIARFYDDKNILTVTRNDFGQLYESIKMSDYNRLESARNAKGEKYNLISLPLTDENVTGLDYRGSYLNYYIANSVIIMPMYNDKNDIIAKRILESLYPGRTVIPIDVTPLYKYGGMIHCITQQQPL